MTLCEVCGRSAQRIRRGMCDACYRRARPKGAPQVLRAPAGLDDLAAFVWRYQNTHSVNKLAALRGCTPDDIGQALERGIIALHKGGMVVIDSARSASY